MRPLRRTAPAAKSASLMRSSLERLISISELQRSSGILASVRSRVTPALWTSTSIPPARLDSIADGASASVMSSSSASPPSRPIRAARSSLAAGTSTPMTSAPSRARTSAIAAPIPRAAPVTSALRPASGLSQSNWPRSAGSPPGTGAAMRITCPET